MATYLFRVNWLWDEAQVEGGDVNVWGFHIETPSAAPALADVVADFEASITGGASPLLGFMPADLGVDLYQLYDVAAGGPPIDQVIPTTPVTGSVASALPSEVQVVVSRWVNDGLGRPFKKGRIYIGPLGTNANLNGRPDSLMSGAALNFSVSFHDALVLRGITPVVNTKGALNVPETITQYSIDNAFDTQRRRGLEPTTQSVVQV